MNSKPKYKTKQRDVLLNYLKARPGVHITAGDVCDFFKENGESIGQSTVYRRLETLVDEGVLSKYIIDANSPACFEYMGEETHADSEVCFHCKCEKCGKLIHMHCEELEEIQDHLFNEHGFRINPFRTVFYGICEECISKESKEKKKQ